MAAEDLTPGGLGGESLLRSLTKPHRKGQKHLEEVKAAVRRLKENHATSLL